MKLFLCISVSDHPFFVGVQYHPEFLSRPIKPSPPYFGLLLASVGRLPHYLQKGCRLSPRWGPASLVLQVVTGSLQQAIIPLVLSQSLRSWDLARRPRTDMQVTSPSPGFSRAPSVLPMTFPQHGR